MSDGTESWRWCYKSGDAVTTMEVFTVVMIIVSWMSEDE